MPITFTADTLERLQAISIGKGSFRSFVEVPAGTAYDQLQDFPTDAYRFAHQHRLQSGLLLSEQSTQITENRRCDKIEVITEFRFNGAKKMNINKLIELTGIPDPDISIRRKILLHLTLTSGLALSCVIEGAVFKGYNRTQAVENRAVKIAGSKVRAYLEKHVTFTGDKQTDYNRAFAYLWEHLPNDISDRSETIKRLALLWPN